MHNINLKDNKTKIIKELRKMHALDIVKQLRELDDLDKKYLIELIPIDMTDDIFLELNNEEAFEYFNYLDLVRKRNLLNELSAADLKPLFLEFNEEQKNTFFNFLSTEQKQQLNTLLKYVENNAASVMQNEFLKLNINYTIPDAMRHITKNVHDTDFIDTIFVTDDYNQLVGSVDLKKLIVARKNDDFKSLIDENPITLNHDDSLELATNKISNYDLNIIPVIDLDNKLIGIISADEIFEELALKHESNVDKFVAVGDFDEDSSPVKRAMQRLPWLLVSIVLNLIIALFLSVFAKTIETVKALILFQPMILGMAGNIGMQSIAVTIVKLHLDKTSEIKGHIKKEISIGILNSILIGIAGFILAYVFLEVSGFDLAANIPSIHIAISIGLSLILSMLLSAIFGVLIPIILTKLKVDPAVASGPVISTINDLVALVIYFGIATLMISIIL